MQIPQEAKQKWESLWQQGDITDIAAKSGYSRPTINDAWEKNECSMEVFTVIQEFYNERQATINNLINPQEPAKA